MRGWREEQEARERLRPVCVQILEARGGSGPASADVPVSILAELLRMSDSEMRSGLNDNELDLIEEKWELKFPLDLRALLAHIVPRDWPYLDDTNRTMAFESIDGTMQTQTWLHSVVLESILFDVKSNEFWYPLWEEKPQSFRDQCSIVRKWFDEMPPLVQTPARLMPSMPRSVGNPMISAHQTDFIYYGYDLAHGFVMHFGPSDLGEAYWRRPSGGERRCPGWSDWLDYVQDYDGAPAPDEVIESRSDDPEWERQWQRELDQQFLNSRSSTDSD